MDLGEMFTERFKNLIASLQARTIDINNWRFIYPLVASSLTNSKVLFGFWKMNLRPDILDRGTASIDSITFGKPTIGDLNLAPQG